LVLNVEQVGLSASSGDRRGGRNHHKAELSKHVDQPLTPWYSLLLRVFDCTGTIVFRGAALSPVSLAQQLEQLLLDWCRVGWVDRSLSSGE
jgi:hypothetical protein